MPNELLARLAVLGERPVLAAPIGRLLAAIARTKNRTLDADEMHAAHDEARAIVVQLRGLAARSELHPLPGEAQHNSPSVTAG
ncbi:hypothetical protein [Streptomyces sp. PT12]|uniref:hypothetical protein n=1 Tax=Streptomyces sp. PT12 TaxID=1510197 RepID=UPI0011BE3A4C|nr:hypothetical protein [Streptomyces sp. PT12]